MTHLSKTQQIIRRNIGAWMTQWPGRNLGSANSFPHTRDEKNPWLSPRTTQKSLGRTEDRGRGENSGKVLQTTRSRLRKCHFFPPFSISNVSFSRPFSFFKMKCLSSSRHCVPPGPNTHHCSSFGHRKEPRGWFTVFDRGLIRVGIDTSKPSFGQGPSWCSTKDLFFGCSRFRCVDLRQKADDGCAVFLFYVFYLFLFREFGRRIFESGALGIHKEPFPRFELVTRPFHRK